MILSLSRKSCKVGGKDLRFQAWRRFTKELFTCPPHPGEEPVAEAITFPSHASFTPHFQTLAVHTADEAALIFLVSVIDTYLQL